jgi:hypothetical protein
MSLLANTFGEVRARHAGETAAGVVRGATMCTVISDAKPPLAHQPLSHRAAHIRGYAFWHLHLLSDLHYLAAIAGP